MNIISIISKPELGDIPIMYTLRVISAIQSDYLHDAHQGDVSHVSEQFSKPLCGTHGVQSTTTTEYVQPSSRASADLAAYMTQVHQIISELYHTVESVEEREIIKNELANMAQIC